MSAGWKLALAVGVAVAACAPLGLIALTTAGIAAHGGTDCLAALASPPLSPVPSTSPGSIWARCDGGDGLPIDNQPAGMPAGYQLPSDAQQATVVAFALRQLGKPYVFGAAGPDAWDCSGLVMVAWRQVGVRLTHSTYYMVDEGVPVPNLQAMQPGDLIFIPGSDGTREHPGHVGMYIGRDSAGQQWLEQAPHTGTTVRTAPVRSWAGQIAKIIRPVIP